MKRKLSFIFLLLSFMIFGQKIPTELKTSFSTLGLEDTIETVDGKTITIKSALEKHKNNIVVLDLWATWCGDCITGMPKLKELKAKNPDVKFVYFSMDKTPEAWKNGIEKYHLDGEHYYMGNNWKNNFSTSIDLNWIPRYLVLDKSGNIAKYYAVNAEDPDVQATINKLRTK